MADAARHSPARIGVAAVVLSALLLAIPIAPVAAQNVPIAYTMHPEPIGPPQLTIGALFQPATPTPNESIAVVVVHQIPVAAEIPCPQLAQRGFTVVCTDETGTTWDQLAQGISDGVSYARSLPGVRHVVLLGWSGGGSMAAYYQNVAQNGVAVCRAPERLDPCSSALAKLPRADGVILLDAIPGLAFSFLSALDPAVARPEGLTSRLDPSLDLFLPRNGYNPDPKRSSTYSPSFINRYTQAQAHREAELVSIAQHLEHTAPKASGATVLAVGHDAARIWQQDTSLLARTKGKHLLITPTSPNGRLEVVHSVRVPSDSPIPSSPQADDAAPTDYPVDTFLSEDAIKAPDYRLSADAIEGVDWASSNTSTIVNVGGISVPLLIMSMSAHYWVVPSEMYYRAARRSKQKTLAYVEGAEHTFNPCTACETFPDEFGNTEAELFNFVHRWLVTHFSTATAPAAARSGRAPQSEQPVSSHRS